MHSPQTSNVICNYGRGRPCRCGGRSKFTAAAKTLVSCVTAVPSFAEAVCSDTHNARNFSANSQHPKAGRVNICFPGSIGVSARGVPWCRNWKFAKMCRQKTGTGLISQPRSLKLFYRLHRAPSSGKTVFDKEWLTARLARWPYPVAFQRCALRYSVVQGVHSGININFKKDESKKE